jgi:hypothetical protein
MYVSDRRHCPPAAGPIAVRFPETGKWGAMASDITLAVGDGARHMTYDELAQARGIPLGADCAWGNIEKLGRNSRF